MKTLLYGCSRTEAWASPADWKTTTAKSSLNKKWYVQCDFHDPIFAEKYPKGFHFRKGLNRFKTLEERKAAVAALLEQIPKLFDEQHFNPITKSFMEPPALPEPEKDTLTPETPCAKAIDTAWEFIVRDAEKSNPENKNPFSDVKVAKNRFIKGLRELRFDTTPIAQLSSGQIKQTMYHIGITDGYYNKFMSYLSKIYTELFEYGCVQANPFKMFKKKKPAKKIRQVITQEEFNDIADWLRARHYAYYRYAMIFHLSGARSTEMMRVKCKDVNLQLQEYKVLVKKRNQYTEEIKVILPQALPFWKELLSGSNSPEDYIFSTRLQPGPVPIAPRQISRKWNKYIKKRFSGTRENPITADFYTLKHFFLDKLDALQFTTGQLPENISQIMASHQSAYITRSVYLTNKKKREREVLKKVYVKTPNEKKTKPRQ